MWPKLATRFSSNKITIINYLQYTIERKLFSLSKLSAYYSGDSSTKHWNTKHIGIMSLFKLDFSMVQKQDGCHFVWFSNGPDHCKTEKMAYIFSAIGKPNTIVKQSRPLLFWVALYLAIFWQFWHSNSKRDQYSSPHCMFI